MTEETSKELFDKLLPEVETCEESDTEKLNRLVDELLEHLRYKKFPIRGLNKMMQLGFLFQELENKIKKEV